MQYLSHCCSLQCCRRDVNPQMYLDCNLHFQGLLTSSVTWPFDSLYTISYRYTGNEFVCHLLYIDPYGKIVSSRVSPAGTRHRLEFTPTEVGPHTVDVKYSGQPIHGSPCTSNVYDASRVRISEAPSSGVVGNDVHFTGLYLRLCTIKLSSQVAHPSHKIIQIL